MNQGSRTNYETRRTTPIFVREVSPVVNDQAFYDLRWASGSITTENGIGLLPPYVPFLPIVTPFST